MIIKKMRFFYDWRNSAITINIPYKMLEKKIYRKGLKLIKHKKNFNTNFFNFQLSELLFIKKRKVFKIVINLNIYNFFYIDNIKELHYKLPKPKYIIEKWACYVIELVMEDSVYSMFIVYYVQGVSEITPSLLIANSW